jgi:NitT/TauT family transport system ATP-binding protein
VVQIESLYKTFPENNTRVLDGVSFSLPAGESMAIIGPSGCGKTTLLYVLAGLVRPTSGSVRVNGEQVKTPSRKTAFILQDFGLLPWRTVWQNVCLGMKIQGRTPDAVDGTGERMLATLGLSHVRDAYPGSLSGGEKQRVAIGRALSTEPELLLMDEPFSSLDTLIRENLQNLMLKLWAEKHLTTILVTHSVEEAVLLGRTILILSDRPATVREVVDNASAGTPGYREEDIYFDTCRRIRRLIGHL